MKCPHCGGDLLSQAGGALKLRIGGGVVFVDGVATAECYWCRRQVEVPLSLRTDAPAITKAEEPSFTIAARKRDPVVFVVGRSVRK